METAGIGDGEAEELKGCPGRSGRGDGDETVELKYSAGKLLKEPVVCAMQLLVSASSDGTETFAVDKSETQNGEAEVLQLFDLFRRPRGEAAALLHGRRAAPRSTVSKSLLDRGSRCMDSDGACDLVGRRFTSTGEIEDFILYLSTSISLAKQQR